MAFALLVHFDRPQAHCRARLTDPDPARLAGLTSQAKHAAGGGSLKPWPMLAPDLLENPLGFCFGRRRFGTSFELQVGLAPKR